MPIEYLTIQHHSVHPMTYPLSHDHHDPVVFNILNAQLKNQILDGEEILIHCRMLSKHLAEIHYYVHHRGNYRFPILMLEIVSPDH